MSTSSHDSDVATCANCGGPLERVEEYALDIAGEDVLFYADGCTSCRSEYVNAPDVLRPDEELLALFRPGAGPLGSYRKIMTLGSRDPDLRHQLRPRVAAALLGHLLQEDLADVVLLAHQGVSEEPVVAFTKADLFRAGEIRMGPGRSVFTGAGCGRTFSPSLSSSGSSRPTVGSIRASPSWVDRARSTRCASFAGIALRPATNSSSRSGRIATATSPPRPGVAGSCAG